MITLLLDVLGFGLIIPIFPELIKEVAREDTAHAALTLGYLVAVFSLVQFIFSPILGGLSDQYGRRPILLVSLFGLALDYLLLAFAPSLGWVWVGRIIAGMTAANITAATAYIADVSKPEDRAKNFGMMGAVFSLGFIIGPAVGGFLGEYSTRLPFFFAAGLAFLNWLYGFFILPESHKPENRGGSLESSRTSQSMNGCGKQLTQRENPIGQSHGHRWRSLQVLLTPHPLWQFHLQTPAGFHPVVI